MSKKIFIDPELHGTRGLRFRPKLGLTGIENHGSGFSKKAGMKYNFINYNREGVSNIIKWFI